MTKLFFIVDEAEVAKQKCITLLVGSLDAPNQAFLVDCHPLDSCSNIDSSIILHSVDDILRIATTYNKTREFFIVID